MPILPKERDPRLITIRRGGTLTDEHHRLLADWALVCAEHVLHLFESDHPDDSRPRDPVSPLPLWVALSIEACQITVPQCGPTFLKKPYPARAKD